MAYGRVSMRVAREILRLQFEARLSHRQIGRACGASCSTVSEAVGRFQAAGLSWPLPAELPDSALGGRLYRERGETASDTREPDWRRVHKELARRHVTLALWVSCRPRHKPHSRSNLRPTAEQRPTPSRPGQIAQRRPAPRSP